MTGFLLIFICLILGFIALLRYKRLYNPVFVFCILFSFCTWLSTMEIDNVSIPSNNTYLMVGVGIIFFWIGGMTADNSFIARKKEYSFNINKKRLMIVSIVGILSSIIELKNTISVFLSGGIREVYSQRLSVEFNAANNALAKNYFESLSRQFIFAPVMTFLIPVFIYLYFKENKGRYLCFSLVALFSFLISNGGRTVVIIYLIYYGIVFVLKNSNSLGILTIQKSKLKYVFGGLLGFVILCYVFFQRETNISRTIGSYFGYPFIHMEVKLKQATYYQYTYGITTFQGLLRPIMDVFELAFVMDFKTLENAAKVSDIANSATRLSSNVMYNAFVTPFYYFYIDFGWFGIMMLSYIFGWFSNKRYIKCLCNKDDRSVLFFLLSFASPICFSFVRMQYALENVPWAMIIAFYVCSIKNSNLQTESEVAV